VLKSSFFLPSLATKWPGLFSACETLLKVKTVFVMLMIEQRCLALVVIDIDECANKNGGCGQVCENTPGSYRCSCVDSDLGYDGKSCFSEFTFCIYTINVLLYFGSNSVFLFGFEKSLNVLQWNCSLKFGD
jgi:hypothetical protein